MSAERLTSSSISVATRAAAPTMIRLNSPVSIPGDGGHRVENFSFKSLVTIAKPKPAEIKIFKIPAASPKVENPLKMPHLEILKPPTLDYKVSQNVFGKDYKTLWQAPYLSGTGQAPKPQPEKPKVQPKIEQPALKPTPKEEPKPEAIPAKTEQADKLADLLKEYKKAQLLKLEATQPVAKPAQSENSPQLKVQETAVQTITKITQKVNRLEPKVAEIAKEQLDIQPLVRATATTLNQEVTKTQVLAMKAELKAAFVSLQQVEQIPPTKAQAQMEKVPQVTADLQQAVKTYQQLKEGLQAAQLKPQETEKQAQIMVFQALKPELKLTFQNLIKENPQLTVEIVEKKLKVVEEEEQVVELIAERDVKADAARENEALYNAQEALKEREDENLPISGVEIVAKMSQPGPEAQKSEIIKNSGQHIIDGSRQMALQFIASATVWSIEGAKWIIKKAIQLFPAVRFRTRVTTERLAQENVERVHQGETYAQRLQNTLSTLSTLH